jgi:hypothetical protein
MDTPEEDRLTRQFEQLPNPVHPVKRASPGAIYRFPGRHVDWRFGPRMPAWRVALRAASGARLVPTRWMATFQDMSESQWSVRRDGAGVGDSRDDSSSQGLAPGAPKPGVLSHAEIEELRRRAADARERTKELIGTYLAACARMNAALARHREAVSAREDSRAALSASVARYALILRALGEPPERTLVLIKNAFSEAAPHQDEVNRAALEDIVKWIVTAYYAA